MSSINELDENDIGMTNDQYSDMIENMNILDHYNNISNNIYNEIMDDINVSPHFVLSKLNKFTPDKFWQFIVENCIGIKYLNNINNIYNFKDNFKDNYNK